MDIKSRAIEIYNNHIELATTNGKLFRKTVMEQLIAETGCSAPGAATQYNIVKKMYPVEGLGRTLAVGTGVRKITMGKGKPTVVIPDTECYSVLELVPHNEGYFVGRCRSYDLQGDASEAFDERCEGWPDARWVMIQGLGPNSGDTFRLEPEEQVIKRYDLVDTVAA
jgi:hypothetical protein